MTQESPAGTLSRLSASSLGVFRGHAAVEHGVTRNQLASLRASGVVERMLPDTYRMTVVAPSGEQSLRAALLWAGTEAIAAGRSAGEIYRLEGVRAPRPEIVVPRGTRLRSADVIVHRSGDRAALMVRSHRGLRVTGVEPTLVALAASLDNEAFEIACEDARRRRLTSVQALRSYLERFTGPGRPGFANLRKLLREIDPVHAARSTLEVKTRRLLVANGLTDFVREFPLQWRGRTYRFDFAFERRRTILETNGRRWHDDPNDYEPDNEKWSVPGRHGYRIVFATWNKVTHDPDRLLAEVAATLAASDAGVNAPRAGAAVAGVRSEEGAPHPPTTTDTRGRADRARARGARASGRRFPAALPSARSSRRA
jgi:very-short-patch-repair endonuclease